MLLALIFGVISSHLPSVFPWLVTYGGSRLFRVYSLFLLVDDNQRPPLY